MKEKGERVVCAECAVKRENSEKEERGLESKADLDRLLNKVLQAPSLGGGCVIPITGSYSKQ